MRGSFIVVAALALSGCAGVHPYNDTRAGYATSAQTAFQKADFDAFMKTRRGNLDSLHARDLQLVELHAKVERDQVILAVFGSSTNWSQLDAGFAELDETLGVNSALGTPPSKCATSWVTMVGDQPRIAANCLLFKENDRSQRSADLAVSEDGFRLAWRLDPPACDASVPLPADWSPGAPGPSTLPKRYAAALKDLSKDAVGQRQWAYEDVLTKCRKLLDDEKAETSAMAGVANQSGRRLPDLQARLMAAKALYQQQVADAQAAADSLQAAADALKKATPDASTETISGAAGKAEAGVAAALEVLEAAGQATGIGQSEAAQAKLAAIDAFIAAISTSSQDAKSAAQPSAALTPDLAQAAAVLKTIPSLADQVVAVGSALHAPRLSALQMEKARQAALVAQASRRQARAAQRVAILQANYDDQVETLRQLNNARLERGAAMPPAAQKKGSKTGALDDNANIEALNYYQIAVYLNVRSMALQTADQVDLEEQASADTAQFAIDSYRAAISTPLAQFVSYENAGVKPADVAQALAGIATAAGVNIIAGK